MGACPARHWLDLPIRHPAGGLPVLPPAYPATVVPAGGACPLCRLPTLPLAYFSAPIPPAPFPSGEGGTSGYFYARGGAPCIPGAEPARHWGRGEPRARRGAQGGGRPPTLPLRCSQGGLPALSPANPAFSLLFCPYPPDPLPGGKGETLGYFMQGASPLASPRLSLRGTGSPCRCGKLNGGLASALPTRRMSAVPGGGAGGRSPADLAAAVFAGGLACFVACLRCL